MGKQRQFQMPAIGSSALLVIFAVLCLTVFALLGLSTAQKGQRLSQISAQAVSDYYAADAKAEEILAQLRSGTVPESVHTEDGEIFTYQCAVTEKQELQVTVRLTNGSWDVLQWQVIPLEWESTDVIRSLWDGET